MSYEVCIIGGAGHVGLPLGILLADKNIPTLVYDINKSAIEQVKGGQLPFLEEDADHRLSRVLEKKTLGLSTEISDIKNIPYIIVTIGTLVDEFLSPKTKDLADLADEIIPHISDDQTILLRATVSPGITDWFKSYLLSKGKKTEVAFCPERTVQGKTIEEIQELPQIISGTTEQAEERAHRFFKRISANIVSMKTKEAEFAKLFSNAYRYLQFAASNQFYMMATEAGLDYSKIEQGMKSGYDRLKDFPGAGFAAGPCLFKDTMQLNSYYENQFQLGASAMLINEGLPLFIVNQLSQNTDLQNKTVGLLGMAFKANSDDTRSSLSYKLKKALLTKAKSVICTDPHVVTDSELLPLTDVLDQADILILCTPHDEYKGLNLRGKPFVDIWNFFEQGTEIPSGNSSNE